jgi:hypothetical protein
VVGVAAGYDMDDKEIGTRIPALARCFSVMKSTQPPVQWESRASSLGIKWPEPDADYLYPSSSKFKMYRTRSLLTLSSRRAQGLVYF